MDLRLHAYLQTILERAHHITASASNSALPESLKEKMIADLRIQLEQRLMAELLDKLSAADQQAYAELIETDPNQQDVVAFLNNKITGAEQIVQTTMQQFEADYIATVNYHPKVS